MPFQSQFWLSRRECCISFVSAIRAHYLCMVWWEMDWVGMQSLQAGGTHFPLHPEWAVLKYPDIVHRPQSTGIHIQKHYLWRTHAQSLYTLYCLCYHFTQCNQIKTVSKSLEAFWVCQKRNLEWSILFRVSKVMWIIRKTSIQYYHLTHICYCKIKKFVISWLLQ